MVADCDTCNKFDDSFVVPKNGDEVSRSDSSSSSNSTSSSYQSTSSSSSSVSDDRGTVKMCQSETFDENLGKKQWEGVDRGTKGTQFLDQ